MQQEHLMLDKYYSLTATLLWAEHWISCTPFGAQKKKKVIAALVGHLDSKTNQPNSSPQVTNHH
jgi:hypothetical protein